MTKRRRWLLLSAALLLIIGAFAWWNERETYTRYVSPPLPDGTRYTFLYPARMKTVEESSAGKAVGISSGFEAPSRVECIAELLGKRGVAAPRVTSGIWVSIRAVKKGEKPVPRHDVRAASQHDVWLYQAKQRRLFILQHNAQRTPLKQFRREAKVVSDSFRLLAPGAPIPQP